MSIMYVRFETERISETCMCILIFNAAVYYNKQSENITWGVDVFQFSLGKPGCPSLIVFRFYTLEEVRWSMFSFTITP